MHPLNSNNTRDNDDVDDDDEIACVFKDGDVELRRCFYLFDVCISSARVTLRLALGAETSETVGTPEIKRVAMCCLQKDVWFVVRALVNLLMSAVCCLETEENARIDMAVAAFLQFSRLCRSWPVQLQCLTISLADPRSEDEQKNFSMFQYEY